jgi:hypothetical protein
MNGLITNTTGVPGTGEACRAGDFFFAGKGELRESGRPVGNSCEHDVIRTGGEKEERQER